MGKEGRKIIVTRFTVQAKIDQLSRIYCSVLREKR